MSTPKTNTIPTEDLRAINGPVPRDDGRVAAVVQDPDTQKWHYSISPLNPKTKEGREKSAAVETADQARKELSEHFTGADKKAWAGEPHLTLDVGQPWFRQRVGTREVPAEAVFARACYTGNVDLAMASVEKVARPNALDAKGNSLLVYAAGMKESAAPMDALLEKGADPRRANPQGWSPSHAAAALGEGERVVSLAKRGANPSLPDTTGKSALSLLPVAERKRIEPELPKLQGPKPNPMAQGKPLSSIPRTGQDRGISKGRDVRHF